MSPSRVYSRITSDIDDARVFGGIHYRFDQEVGAEQGRQVGAYVYRHSLRPARGCACDDEDVEDTNRPLRNRR
jgi:hypothetical protein